MKKSVASYLFPLSLRIDILSALVPRRYWFRCIGAISTVQGYLRRWLGDAEWPERAAFAREGYLTALHRRHGMFPIPLIVKGSEALRPNESDHGLLYCGIHVPLMRVSVWMMKDLGGEPSLVVAHPNGIMPDGCFESSPAVPGPQAAAPGIGAMLRTRTVLRARGTVCTMVDVLPNGPLYAEMMLLAGRMKARVVMFWSEMGQDGNVLLTYRTAPHPVPDTEKKVRENLTALEEQRVRIFAELRQERTVRSRPFQAGVKKGDVPAAGR